MNTNSILYDAIAKVERSNTLTTEEAQRAAYTHRVEFERGGVHLSDGECGNNQMPISVNRNDYFMWAPIDMQKSVNGFNSSICTSLILGASILDLPSILNICYFHVFPVHTGWNRSIPGLLQTSWRILAISTSFQYQRFPNAYNEWQSRYIDQMMAQLKCYPGER